MRVFINQLRNQIEPSGPLVAFIATETRIGYCFVLTEAAVWQGQAQVS